MLVLLNYIQILYQNKYKSFCQQHPLQKKEKLAKNLTSFVQ